MRAKILQILLCQVFLAIALIHVPGISRASEYDDFDYVCASDAVKSGSVVDAIIKSNELAGYCKDGLVKRVRDVSLVKSTVIEVCQGSTIPAGWVIVETVSGAPNCPGPTGYLAYRIERVQGLSQINACSISQIPVNWVITRVNSGDAKCYDPGKSMYLSYTLADSVGQTAMQVCGVSPIPSGWVITATTPGVAECLDMPWGGYRAFSIINLN